MATQNLKTGIKIGIASALAIILFEVSNTFLVYRYFKFDYYITAIAILFLIAGFFIAQSKFNGTQKENIDDTPTLLSNLTSRELVILQLIIEGKSNKEIATLSYVEVSTIKTHINHIYAKLGLRNRKDAMNYKTKLTGLTALIEA